MRIALAQINTTVGDLSGNLEKIADFIAKAKKHECDMVAFPELAICGYPPEDLLLKEHFVDDNLKALRSLIKNTKGMTVIVGFVDRDAKKNIYNAAAIIHNGRLKAVYHKMDLPNYGVFDEKRYFKPGERNSLFMLGKRIFGVTICEDIWKKEGAQRLQAKCGAKVLINISASPYHAGKIKEREQMLKKRARENKAYICYVNTIGGQDELVFDGASFIIDPRGGLVAAGRQFEEDFIMADLKVDSSRIKTSKDIKGIVICEEIPKEKKSPIKPSMAKKFDSIEEIYRALVLGTRDYIGKNGFKKAVIGLSGGIDSSLVAVIATDAIGKENVVGVSMPSQFSSQGTRTDAKTMANNLGIRFIEIPIEDILTSYLKALEKELSTLKRDITEENIQARIRGNILMALSNKFGWLVLTTGNKSEIAVGYCTLYGDMAGGFAVIKDVPKTTIYELAQFRNRGAKQELIPQSVILRAPTAELRENQKDEDSLPSYSKLDPILKGYVEFNRSLAQLAQDGEVEVIKEVIRMVDHSEYKRRQSPPGIKITPRAFGKDRRLPITNKYKEV